MTFYLMEHSKIDAMYKVRSCRINLIVEIQKKYPIFNPALGYSKATERKRILDKKSEKYRSIATLLTASHLFVIVQKQVSQLKKDHLYTFKNITPYEKVFFDIRINKHPLTNTSYESINSMKMLNTRHPKLYLPSEFFKQGYVHHVNDEYNLFLVLSQSILVILDHLEPMGRLKIKLDSTTLDCTIELLWLIAQCFVHVYMYRLELSICTNKDSHIKFINF